MSEKALPFWLRVEQTVGYGFYFPGGAELQRWQAAPAGTFRPTRLFAWGEGTGRVRLLHFRLGASEQLVAPLPGELLSSWPTAEQFLTIYGARPEALPGFHRFVFRGLPQQAQFPVPLDFPTIPLGQSMETEWTGQLRAFFVCGREISPERRDSAAARPKPEEAL